MLAVVARTGAIATHHSGVVAMSDAHDDPGAAAMELCLGVFAAVGAAVAAVGPGVIALGRWRPPAELEAVGLSPPVPLRSPAPEPGPRSSL